MILSLMLLPAFQPSWVYKKNQANYFKKIEIISKIGLDFICNLYL